MNQPYQEEINIVCEEDQKIAIFDRDNWDHADKDQLKEASEEGNSDPKIIKQITSELENSKENFFKVNIVKQKKQGDKNLKKLTTLKNFAKNSILKQGNMQKKTDGFFFVWHKRYIALTPQKLFIFQNQLKQKVVSCVNFKILSTVLKEREGSQLLLDFCGECQNLILKCKKEEKQQWKMYFEMVINHNKNADKLLILTLMKPIYELKNILPQKQFLEGAQTGDLLLFTTKNTGAKIQRVLTNSEYDHVAMLVKFKNKQLMIFQANQPYGVCVFSWTQYIKYFDLYECIVLRKLSYIKKEEAHPILLSFVRNNIGKKYEISAGKLLKFQTDVDWQQLNREKERGYFCSELIAKAYKSLGFLDEKMSSGRYWPVDFSQKNGMKLKKGACLGPEQTILLNKHVKNKI